MSFLRDDIKSSQMFYLVFTSCVSGRGNKIGPMFPSFRLSVRPSVSTLMSEPFDVWTCKCAKGFQGKTVDYEMWEVRQRWGVFSMEN